MRRPLFLMIIGAATCCAATAAAIGMTRQLPKVSSESSQPVAPNQVDAPTVKAGATYQASLFPLAVRVAVPSGTWRGAQGRSLAKGVTSTEQGPFGWVELYRPAPGDQASGYLAMIAAYGRAPSVAATVSGLRTRGHGATFQANTPVKVGGFSGIQFDGVITGPNHHFVPFTPRSSAARFYPDMYTFEGTEAFRIVVLNVRGKTVVVFIESGALPADQFSAFLLKADQILKSLRFLR